MTSTAPRGSVLEVLWVFLRLGLTSFGGPVAHLGYFRSELVQRRQWLDDQSYSDLVALCQFLPGPASSQVGMALGLRRAGWWGALAAWLGFTLPSALVLMLCAYGVAQWSALAASGGVQGLKVAAVAVVAQAVWGMAKSLCPDRLRAGMAVGAALWVLAVPGSAGQVGAMVLGGLLGHWALPSQPPVPALPAQGYGVGRRTGALLLVLCAALLLALPWAVAPDSAPLLRASAAFYQAGALVFGGGHVVLPLLQSAVVPEGLIDNGAFLAGYGAAQAMPGPLFAFAAYLGVLLPGSAGGGLGGVWSSLWAGLALLVAVFLPGFLLLVGALPFWDALRQRGGVQRAMGGINAAVVGLLLAALYDPVWVSAIHSRADFALALAAFGLLVYGRVSAVWVVVLAGAAGWLMAL